MIELTIQVPGTDILNEWLLGESLELISKASAKMFYDVFDGQPGRQESDFADTSLNVFGFDDNDSPNSWQLNLGSTNLGTIMLIAGENNFFLRFTPAFTVIG